jgi:hypothetical protein
LTPEELVDWVEGLVAMLESVDRSQNQYWCVQWWNHPEAVDRLRGLYEQWLEAQANGGMSSWWIDHFDRHATVLFRSTHSCYRTAAKGVGVVGGTRWDSSC